MTLLPAEPSLSIDPFVIGPAHSVQTMTITSTVIHPVASQPRALSINPSQHFALRSANKPVLHQVLGDWRDFTVHFYRAFRAWYTYSNPHGPHLSIASCDLLV